MVGESGDYANEGEEAKEGNRDVALSNREFAALASIPARGSGIKNDFAPGRNIMEQPPGWFVYSATFGHVHVLPWSQSVKTIRLAAHLFVVTALAGLTASGVRADPAATQPSAQQARDAKFAAALSRKMSAFTGNAPASIESAGPTVITVPSTVVSQSTVSSTTFVTSAPPAPIGHRVVSPRLLTEDAPATDEPALKPNRNIPPRGYVDSTLVPEIHDESVRGRMNAVVDSVNLQNVPAKRAFAWWSNATGVPLVINWDSLANQNVQADTQITLSLNRVPAGKLLGLLMQQTTLDTPMLYEQNTDYVEVMTKADANRRPVVEVYEVQDLLDEPVDAASHAPKFDFASAISSGGGATGGGGGSGGISGGTSSMFNSENSRKSGANRADELCKLIRDTVEPEVWAESGGTCTLRMFNGNLIVKAPMYVQVQIGLPITRQTEPRPIVFIVNAGK